MIVNSLMQACKMKPAVTIRNISASRPKSEKLIHVRGCVLGISSAL